MRVANVYDLSPKTYLLKLSGGENKKVFLLLDSGISFHTTDLHRYCVFFISSSQDPKRQSYHSFCVLSEGVLLILFPLCNSVQLRKHIRTKRIENIEQLGIDRVVVFT